MYIPIESYGPELWNSMGLNPELVMPYPKISNHGKKKYPENPDLKL